MSFAGQYAGPLDTSTLEHLSRVYSLASVVGVEAARIALFPHMIETREWDKRYRAFEQTLHSRAPAHLQKSLDEDQLKQSEANDYR